MVQPVFIDLKKKVKRAKALWVRHKETLSLLASAGALLISGFTYVATVWRAHDLTVFVRTSIVEGEKYPIQVLLSNIGEHTEVVLSAEIFTGQCSGTEREHIVRGGVPRVLVIQKASHAITEISVSPSKLVEDANALHRDRKGGTFETGIVPNLVIEYLSPSGLPKWFCEPVGKFDFADGSGLYVAVEITGTGKSVQVFRSVAVR